MRWAMLTKYSTHLISLRGNILGRHLYDLHIEAEVGSFRWKPKNLRSFKSDITQRLLFKTIKKDETPSVFRREHGW